jgi:hypothetical protein
MAAAAGHKDWRPMSRNDRQKQRPRLVDRLELRLSTSKRVDGLWVGTYESDPEQVLRRVEEALGLIEAYDRLRYDRLTRDLERVWVRLLHTGALGSFNESVSACELDVRFVLAETSTPEVIAATIVHEAAHARLRRRGVGYEEELRVRVEAICFRRELAFAKKLPNGEQVHEQAERMLELCSTHDYWSNTAFEERYVAGGIEAARHVGLPYWLARAALVLRALRLRPNLVDRFHETNRTEQETQHPPTSS